MAKARTALDILLECEQLTKHPNYLKIKAWLEPMVATMPPVWIIDNMFLLSSLLDVDDKALAQMSAVWKPPYGPEMLTNLLTLFHSS
jgi:hypothetical protein